MNKDNFFFFEFNLDENFISKYLKVSSYLIPYILQTRDDALLLFSAVAVNCTNSLFKRAIFTWKMAFRFINWAAEHSICSVGRAKKEGRKRRRPLPTTLSSAPYGFTMGSIKFWSHMWVSVYHWSHKCKKVRCLMLKKFNLKETSINCMLSTTLLDKNFHRCLLGLNLPACTDYGRPEKK